MITSKNKKKVLVITGSRAEYGLLKPVMDEIAKSDKLELRLLVTGMHTLRGFGWTLREIKRDEMPVHSVVKIGEDDDMVTALSKELKGISAYCRRDRPDLVLVLGDRDEAFAGAIVGGHLKIPVGHIHGGDLTGYTVDEYVRHAITKFSHLHFVATRKSFERVVGLCEEKRRVFLVGAPGLDHLRKIRYFTREELAREFNLDWDKQWFLIVQHPTPLDRVRIEDQIRPLFSAVSQFAAEKIVIYPNADTGSRTIIRAINRLKNKDDFRIFRNLERRAYLSLMKQSDILIGNSSSGIIESAFFKLPTVNVGSRQKGRERSANVIDCGYGEREIASAIRKALAESFRRQCEKTKNFYGNGTTGRKIARILEAQIGRRDLFFKRFVLKRNSKQK